MAGTFTGDLETVVRFLGIGRSVWVISRDGVVGDGAGQKGRENQGVSEAEIYNRDHCWYKEE